MHINFEYIQLSEPTSLYSFPMLCTSKVQHVTQKLSQISKIQTDKIYIHVVGLLSPILKLSHHISPAHTVNGRAVVL